MKIAIFSDIHGNLPAFELMLKDAGNVDKYICLGDVVNYGPWSNECVQLLISLKNCIKIKGNHDRYFIFKKCDDNNTLAKTFFKFCIDKFFEFSALKTFQDDYILDNYYLAHTINDSRIYPDTNILLTKNYVVGHSHYQFSLKSNNFILYNTGSIGQNRKHINVIDYIIYYVEDQKFEMRNIVYDVDRVINKMKEMKYPIECINYYNKKSRK